MRIISGTARGTKLYTLEGETTRPTLDRVREAIFNIIQNDIRDANVLDLFSGSGAIALEAASRGAKKVYLCDKSKKAMDIINRNIEKTHLEDKIKTYNIDFKECLKKLSNERFDIIYLDPPYKTKFIEQALDIILNLKLIHNNSKIIIETDSLEKIKEIEKDALRTEFLEQYGLKVIRISNLDINKNFEGVCIFVDNDNISKIIVQPKRRNKNHGDFYIIRNIGGYYRKR